MNNKNSKVINLNWIDKSSRSAIIPGYTNKKKIKKLKELTKSKGNCLFSPGISNNLINFIYRAVVQLNLKDKKFIFSRGAVKINDKPVKNAIGIRELEWGVGISMRIPNKLNYNNKIKLSINKENHEIRIMEMIVLTALLHIAYPSKKNEWCSNLSVLIIIKGWQQLEMRI